MGASRGVLEPKQLQEDGELMQLTGTALGLVALGKGYISGCIKHASFEGIQDGERIRGA